MPESKQMISQHPKHLIRFCKALLRCMAILICVPGIAGADSPSGVGTDRLTPAAKALFADREHMTEFTLVSDHAPDPGEKDVELKLLVPNIYINRDAMEPGNRETYFHLKMLWPSLEGTSIRTRDIDQAEYDEEMRVRDTGHFFGVQFFKGRLDRSATMIADHIERYWVRFTRDPQMPGFTKYADKSLEKQLDAGIYPLMQYLVPTDTTYPYPVYFQCPVGNSTPHQSLGCTGFNYLGHYVYGEYDFAFSELENWKAIDTQVRNLFAAMLEQNK